MRTRNRTALTKAAVSLLLATLQFLFVAPAFHAVQAAEVDSDAIWATARRRAAIYEQCARNAARLLQGWIDLKRDPATHLYSRGARWDYHNEAADHYSSLVLVAFYVNPELIAPGGTLHQTLVNHRELCPAPTGIPALYDLKRGTPLAEARLDHLTEWLRDGLIRIVEIMGVDNDWYREMVRLTDAMLAEAQRRGGIAVALPDAEAAGNMLQTLARLHAVSGNPRYLAAAESLADFHLGNTEATFRKVRFGDHGCELIPGLAELFALECQLGRPQASRYGPPLSQILDRILLTSAHPQSGLLCRQGKPRDGQKTWQQPPDTWGYVLFAYENYDRGLRQQRYRAALEKPLRWLIANRSQFGQLRQTLWPRAASSDDWSDSYESMIVLYNRYPHIAGADDWLDWATRQHIHRKNPERKYGPYTGGHFDGSVGRTLCMHMMLNSQGVRTVPFVEGLRLGAARSGDSLYLAIESDAPWRGKLCFDPPRTNYPTANMNWARINEMPQWFVVRPDQKYRVRRDGSKAQRLSGHDLIGGMPCSVAPGKPQRFVIGPL